MRDCLIHFFLKWQKKQEKVKVTLVEQENGLLEVGSGHTTIGKGANTTETLIWETVNSGLTIGIDIGKQGQRNTCTITPKRRAKVTFLRNMII